MFKWLNKINPFKSPKHAQASVSPAKSTKQIDRSASGFRKTGIIVILASALAMAAIIIYDILYCSNGRTQLWECVYTIGINLAAAGITIGIGTILYGHFDFVQYVRNTLCKVIFEFDFVDNLNDEEKSNLMRKLQKDIIYHHKESGNNTLFDFVNNELATLTQGPYYESVDAYFYCKLDGNMIEKHIVRRLVINIEQAPDYKYDLIRQTKCYFFEPTDGSHLPAPYKIVHLTINDKNLDSAIEQHKEPVPDERGYHFVVYYDFKSGYDVSALYEDKDILTVEIEYITRVDSSDKSLVFRTYYPCKQLHTSFICQAPLRVHPDIFCFKGRSSNGFAKDFVHVQTIENSVHIDISNWTLPGDGIIYLLELDENVQSASTSEPVSAEISLMTEETSPTLEETECIAAEV